jgi:hypothetical protein
MIHSTLLAAWFFLRASEAGAQRLPIVICGNLPGCGLGPSNVPLEILGYSAQFLVNIAAGLSLLLIIFAGITMLIAQGEDAKISKAKLGIAAALGGLALAIASQTVVSFIVTEDYGATGGISSGYIFTGLFPAAVRIVMALFNVAFLLVMISSGIRLLMSGGKADEYNKSIHIIRWAISGAIVVNAARAILQAFFQLNL